MVDTTQGLIQRLDSRMAMMRDDRQSFDGHYREIAEHTLPRRGRFMLGMQNKGDKRHGKIIDSTPLFARRTLASGMMAGITSPAKPWFLLTVSDPTLAERQDVKDWLHAVTQRMRDVFQRSNLYSALPVLYSELGSFGTAAMCAMEDSIDTVRFYTYTVGSYWLAQNGRQSVDTLARQYSMTVRQIVEEFGEENCSAATKRAWQNKEYDKWVDVAHMIQPIGTTPEEARSQALGMQFSSVYWEIGQSGGARPTWKALNSKPLRASGFYENPILAPRWEVVGEDIYGGSCPGMDALPECKALQLQQKRKAQAIDKHVDPPMTGPSSLKNTRASLLPGDLTIVDATAGGSKFEPAYAIKPEINPLREDIAEIEARINTAFYADLFLMLAMSDRREITAREVEERHEEKLLMLGPVLERLNDELLGPLIDRTFAIMLRNGMIPPPPVELEGQPLKVEYISILAQAQKMIGLGAMDRLVLFAGQAVAASGGQDMSVLDKIDFDQSIDEYSLMLGTPPRVVRSDDAVAALRAERMAGQVAAQLAAAAGPVAKAAKDTAEIDPNADSGLKRVFQQVGAA